MEIDMERVIKIRETFNNLMYMLECVGARDVFIKEYCDIHGCTNRMFKHYFCHHLMDGLNVIRKQGCGIYLFDNGIVPADKILNDVSLSFDWCHTTDGPEFWYTKMCAISNLKLYDYTLVRNVDFRIVL